ncbi:hypothetical protein HYN69_11945 [Gemmobacter aquarius]|uniref:Sulfotransferase family protein n=1 Tax=Paragemmobacter aquarius TaxID=2169400 RepID=A0A2S0UMV4_9RHOB|nr:hypothetical protein [Gemmobacter aquarius]AWB49121.1 hypothetical protein HYN69_11945 [Gemmobacter aquarius]
MPDHILLHIGMHKTGTTALQHALHDYDDGQIRYARLGHSNHSIPVVTCFASEPHRYHVWKRIGATRQEVARKVAFCRERLESELALPRKRLLFVGEEISLLPTAAVTALSATLHRSGAEISVLAYLRDPLGYVTSAFQQQVRGGQACYTLPRPYYRQRFEKFTAIFGRNAVSFRAYAPERTAGWSIISDYSGAAGLPPRALADCRSNPSLPLDAVRLLHLFNRTNPQIGSETGLAARSALISYLAACFTTRFTIDPGIVAAVVDADELAWVEDTTGIPLRAVPGATDPTRAEAALAAYLDDIPPQAIDRLRHDLSLRSIPHDSGDDAASLVSKLYAGLLAAQEAARTTPAPKSASA